MSRTTITVQRDTAMDLREVRIEMSRASGTMMTTDDVLASLISYWRQGQRKVPSEPTGDGHA